MRRRRPDPTLQPDDLTLCELLSLESGWMPPRDGQPRADEQKLGTTWGSFLAVWSAVRAVLITDCSDAFAERARRFAEVHGLAALEAATYEAIRGLDADQRPPSTTHAVGEEVDQL